MGGQAQVMTLGGHAGTLGRGVAALHDLERRWSRFLPDSEVSRVNAAGARQVTVSQATATLFALAVDGWRVTEGRYDPTVLDAVVAAGYDRSFTDIGDGDQPMHAEASW
jgi:thiamine biosynthesis lipoprotein